MPVPVVLGGEVVVVGGVVVVAGGVVVVLGGVVVVGGAVPLEPPVPSPSDGAPPLAGVSACPGVPPGAPA